MKALSLHPVFADSIAAGEKKTEYRTWSTDYRGPLLICASTHNDGPDFVRGHAICTAELYDIAAKDRHGNYRWRLRDIRFIEPLPVKGRLHLFDVDDSQVRYLDCTYEALTDLWRARGLIADDI